MIPSAGVNIQKDENVCILGLISKWEIDIRGLVESINQMERVPHKLWDLLIASQVNYVKNSKAAEVADEAKIPSEMQKGDGHKRRSAVYLLSV